MQKLLDLAAVYVEVLEKTPTMSDVRFIILDEQGEEIAHLSLDSAQSITEATLAYMEWEDVRSRGNIH